MKNKLILKSRSYNSIDISMVYNTSKLMYQKEVKFLYDESIRLTI